MDHKQQLARLQQQFNDAVAAEGLINSNIFDIEKKILQTMINQSISVMSGDECVDNHNKYLAARAELNVCRKLIARLERTAASKASVQGKIDDLKAMENE